MTNEVFTDIEKGYLKDLFFVGLDYMATNFGGKHIEQYIETNKIKMVLETKVLTEEEFDSFINEWRAKDA